MWSINTLDFNWRLFFGRNETKLNTLIKSVIETKKTKIDPTAASSAYCFTGTNSVTASTLNPIDVVRAVKKNRL